MRHRSPRNSGLTFISRKNSFVGLSEPKKVAFLDIFMLMSI